MTITVEWAPQRTATISLWISLVAGLACIAIVIAASVRRRRRNPGDDPAAASVPTAADPGLSIVLTNAFGSAATGLSTGAVVVTVATTTIATAVLVRPWVGLLIGALTLLAIRQPRWRLVLRVGPAAILAGIMVYMGVGQYLREIPTRFDWPTFYSQARTPAWIAVALLSADALIEIVTRITRRRENAAPESSREAEAERSPSSV